MNHFVAPGGYQMPEAGAPLPYAVAPPVNPPAGM